MIRISKNDRTCNGEIRLPASKSVSNRLLMLQFCYGYSFKIQNLSSSDDTVLLSSLLDLVRQNQLRGDTGLLRIDTRNAGTVMRFLLPLLSATRGHYLLTGSERMLQRPIGPLVESMLEAGAEIDYLEKIGFPPLLIRGRAISARKITVDASLSSQFVSALLLLAPALDEGMTLELTGMPVSWPYVKMTTGILESLGIQVIIQGNTIRVYHKKEIKTDFTVEPDWSASSFWYCLIALAEKGEVFFPGLKKSGLQGDQQVVEFFRQLGVDTTEGKKGIRIIKVKKTSEDFHADFTAYPDLALPVILACASTGIKGTFTGLERLRIKESDRLEAITRGLLKVGIKLSEEFPGIWKLSGHLIDPCKLVFEDYEDHRVAMTFACLSLKGFAICMEHPDAVNKSYPGFWKDLQTAGFNCIDSC